jgi:hypothetical protein
MIPPLVMTFQPDLISVAGNIEQMTTPLLKSRTCRLRGVCGAVK